MDNFTDNFTDSSWVWDDSNELCESVTNHWLYFIFSGYVLPLISPRVRDWLKESWSSCKNTSINGKFVTLTEFGFDKIQEIENNIEMKDYIRRLCIKKNPKLFYSDETLEKISWLFSGESKGDKDSKDGADGNITDGIQQTWKKLNKVIDGIGIKNGRP